jgi:hypothetical protein
MEKHGPRFIRKPMEAVALRCLIFQGTQDDTSACTVTREEVAGATLFLTSIYLMDELFPLRPQRCQLHRPCRQPGLHLRARSPTVAAKVATRPYGRQWPATFIVELESNIFDGIGDFPRPMPAVELEGMSFLPSAVLATLTPVGAQLLISSSKRGVAHGYEPLPG